MANLPDTRRSLLIRLSDVSDQEAWCEFLTVYELAVYRYIRSRGLQHADTQEVVQDVLVAVHRAISKWSAEDHGSFRAWLFRVAFNKSIALTRKRQRREIPTGRTTTYELLAEYPSSDSDVESNSNQRQWQQWAFCCAAGRVQQQVSGSAWNAFWATAVELRPAADVARSSGMTVGAVYAAKCRVLARIRREVQRLDQDFAVTADRHDTEGHDTEGVHNHE